MDKTFGSGKGWTVVDLSENSLELIHEARAEIATVLVRYGLSIEGYAPLDSDHDKIQVEVGEMLIREKYGRRIIQASLPLFAELLGHDIHVQKYPYFRIARPGRGEDNIGLHRDTKYGGSPYEVSTVIPLSLVPEEGSLRVLEGSSAASESRFPFLMVKSTVEKGSDKHKLGFLYAPKRLEGWIEQESTPVRLSLGQALVFPLSLVHGQDVNRSSVARFSTDVRLVNSLAPIEWSKSVHSDFYEPLCTSWVTQNAAQYRANNAGN